MDFYPGRGEGRAREGQLLKEEEVGGGGMGEYSAGDGEKRKQSPTTKQLIISQGPMNGVARKLFCLLRKFENRRLPISCL